MEPIQKKNKKTNKKKPWIVFIKHIINESYNYFGTFFNSWTDIDFSQKSLFVLTIAFAH